MNQADISRPIRLVLNSKASKVLDFHTRHYSGRGLMKKVTGEELAKEIGISKEQLEKNFEVYNKISRGEQVDPWNKKYFHNLPFSADDEFFHVAEMEPVLHVSVFQLLVSSSANIDSSQW